MMIFFIFVLIQTCLASETAAFLRWSETQEKTIHLEEKYRYYSEFSLEIAQQIKANPGVISAFRVGHTVKKRSIWGFRVSNPATIPKYKILVFAGLHPLEWVGVEGTVSALLELSKHPPKNTEVIFVPVFNLDRRLVVEADINKGERKYRRVNANGEDLNRDFEIHREAKAIWRHLYPERYSVSESPLSQPETTALDALASNENFDASISLHSFGGYIYYPWAGRYKRPDDWQKLHQMALAMKQEQSGKHPYRAKQLSHWFFLFRAQGTELDHLYGKYGIHSFLIETTRSGISLWKRETWKDPFRLYNPVDPELDIQRAKNAILGLVRYYESLDE